MIAWGLQREVFANCNRAWSMLGQSMPGARNVTLREGFSVRTKTPLAHAHSIDPGCAKNKRKENNKSK
jgi:hypothetical protein